MSNWNIPKHYRELADELDRFPLENTSASAARTLWNATQGLRDAALDVEARDEGMLKLAGERERLRAVIENAPHEPPCPARLPATFSRPLPCTCWKADAL